MNKETLILFIYLFIGIVLNILINDLVYGYSTYGAPTEFGNLTTTTCWVGGDDGIINCTGTAKFGSVIADVVGTSNSSNYWDSLDSPSDINTADLTDDNKFTTTTGDTFSGNVILDDNSGESPKIRFFNELDNISEIYEQTDGDLYIKAKDGFELVGASYRLTTLTSCDTIDSDSNGVLSCGTDYFISNCSVTNSCNNIIYYENTTWILTSSWANVTAGEWITPSYILDVDDEDIETDLNTYWDIAGDTDSGAYDFNFLNSNLTMSNLAGNISCTNITGAVSDLCTLTVSGYTDDWINT